MSYFKDALKIASKGVRKSRFNVKVKAGRSSVARFTLLWPRWLKCAEYKQTTLNFNPKSTQNYLHGGWGRIGKGKLSHKVQGRPPCLAGAWT